MIKYFTIQTQIVALKIHISYLNKIELLFQMLPVFNLIKCSVEFVPHLFENILVADTEIK